jgi:glucose-6-phosphate isomerase
MSAANDWLSGPRLFLNRSRQALSATALKESTRGLNDATMSGRILELRNNMFAGKKINTSEQRAVGHWVYRHLAPDDKSIVPRVFAPDGKDLWPEMAAAAEKTSALADAVRSGALRAASGKPFRNIVHLGIGGSDVGPHLLIQALGTAQSSGDLRAFFLSNVDFHGVATTLNQIQAQETLVVMVSKSFTTQETMLNAHHLKHWMIASGQKQWQKNFIAITEQVSRAKDWGIDPAQILWFDQSVGGRYSTWGPVSLTARIVLGNAPIDAFLTGGAAVDHHFLTQPLAQNIPAVLAATDFYNLRDRHLPTLMVSAYDSRLTLLVPYLKQLWMESLGKQVNHQGQPLDGPACPILWGDVGTNAQHAFFQLLHQGMQGVAVDLIGVIRPDHASPESHEALLANLIAQSQALSVGREMPDAAKTCFGGHPVNLMLLDQLDGYGLGCLIACWEHRVLCLAALTDVNPFDQWGVELGKQIAHAAASALAHGLTQTADTDSSALDEISQSVIRLIAARGPST